MRHPCCPLPAPRQKEHHLRPRPCAGGGKEEGMVTCRGRIHAKVCVRHAEPAGGLRHRPHARQALQPQAPTAAEKQRHRITSVERAKRFWRLLALGTRRAGQSACHEETSAALARCPSPTSLLPFARPRATRTNVQGGKAENQSLPITGPI